VAAAGLLAGRRPPPLFVAAGDGPLRAELEEQIRRTGAPVHLLGRRDDVADLLAAADLVVLPSVWEGSPLAAQEALVAGRPLVATNAGGTADLVGDGALLVPPADPAALATAIGSLLDDPAAVAALAARARAAVGRLPTEESVLARLAALYTELLGSAR
jgi:glycosyltransferase involved in cell wall biosynthesis